ncbi:MAG: GNAT family N-acetyltransferase [Candidatus Hodarchaeales archaeon]|jgi:ribosomal protein S18 acetylase RimI-like enzyme
MNTNYHFRKLTQDDWLSFKDLEDNAFPRDQIDRVEFDRLTTSRGFIGYFTINNSEVLIGYLYLTLLEDYAHLNRIGIHHNCRGKGFGKLLMEYAINYFLKYNPKEIGIYVETNNNVAINLYQKCGFVIQFESWHYIIDLQSFNKSKKNIENYEIKEVSADDLETLESTFDNFNSIEIRSTLEREKQNEKPRLFFLGLQYNGEFVGFARFNPKFSGCRPFNYSALKHVDPFIELLKKYKIPEKEYIRITFDNYKELAQKFDKEDYEKHHHLYKLVKTIEI